MIAHDKQAKVFTMSNNALTTCVRYGEGVIGEFSNSYAAKKQNEDKALFLIAAYDRIFNPADFKLVSATECNDGVHEMMSLQYDLDAERIKIRVHFINDRRDTISVLYQVWDEYKYGVPYNSRMKLPLLSDLHVDGEGDRFYAPGNSVATPDGRKVIQPMRDYEYSSDVRLPMVVCDAKDQLGFSVRFPSLSDLNDDGANQNASKGLSMLETEAEIRDNFFRINPDRSFNDTAELVITGIRNGWPEAFDRYRDIWSSSYDFARYDDKALEWVNECVVNNFTILFGSESFDHDRQEIDVDGLLKQGEAFGGYDTVTIWNQYPRLGVDARSQWDFYDDFPGGREALKKAIERFHQKGVKVLYGYIPWDRGFEECEKSMGDEFAKLIADTGADGYNLDTMHDVPRYFREKLDALGPGILLLSQFHPSKGHPVELLTSSWDEFWRVNPMPEVDVFRFLNPRHLSPVISRWLRYEDKTVLLNRALFGAAPIVVWQDVFGRWMPFADDQKTVIKEYKVVYLKYRAVYQGDKPIPLYPVFTQGLYCNLFRASNGENEIYSLYNDSDSEIRADGIRLNNPRPNQSARVILGNGSAELSNDELRICLPPHTVMHVLLG